jgi:prepilin-type N-terminal cleavage/methylation domain-containing protein
MSYKLTSSRAKIGDRKIWRLRRRFTPRNYDIIKYKAFTLAEVLITLLIIGVVASLVIPNLIQDAQDAEFKTAWKKEFGILDQATRLVMNDNGGTLISACDDHEHECFRDLLLPYLSYTKICPQAQSLGNCWHPDNTSKNLSGVLRSWENSTSIVFNDGMVIQVYYYSKDCNWTSGNLSDICGKYQIDTNGLKKPNIIGKDIFQVHLTPRGIKPYGTQGDGANISKPASGCDLTIDPNATGISCPADLLYQ